MEYYIIIDSLIFFITNILLVIYFNKNKELNLKEKIIYSIWGIILNSSYNIMIKSVHQYNEVIPRTFIYRWKLLGPFSLFDFISVIYVLFNIKYLFNKLKTRKLLILSALRDASIFIIGAIMFFVSKGYWFDNGSSFFSNAKGIIYGLVILILTFKYMNKNVDLVKPLLLILYSGWISTLFIPIQDIWIRYGHKVVIIDQEDAGSISNFVILLIALKLYFKNYNSKKEFWIYVVLFIITLFQNLYCIYKTNIIVLPTYIIIYLLINVKINKKIIFTTFSSMSLLGIIFWKKIYYLATSVSIKTRFSQLTDLLNYISEKGIVNYVFGIGIGTPYYAPTSTTDDTGEIKEIDMQKFSSSNEWKTTFQIPILENLKNAGIIGMCIYFIFTIIVFFYIIKLIRKLFEIKETNNYKFVETVAFGIFTIVNFSIGYNFFGGIIPSVMFSVFSISKFIINYESLVSIDENNVIKRLSN